MTATARRANQEEDPPEEVREAQGLPEARREPAPDPQGQDRDGWTAHGRRREADDDDPGREPEALPEDSDASDHPWSGPEEEAGWRDMVENLQGR